MDRQVEWTGLGRWLAFVGSAVLLLIGAVTIFSPGQGASAGWSIFLALIIAASVGAGSPSASKLVLGVAALLILRVILLPLLGGSFGDILINSVPAALVTFAAIDLRSQNKDRIESANAEGIR